MSLLAIQIPARPRLAARTAGDSAPGIQAASEFDYVFSADGHSVTHSGRASAAALPKADRVVAVLADADVSWHRIDIPKAPAARMRAALAGALEDGLLDDDAALHLALAPRAVGGQPGWVAATHRRWLAATLEALTGAGHVIERVVPSSAPDEAPGGHFFLADPSDPTPTLALAHAGGALQLRLQGNLARSLLPPDAVALHWSATPAASAAAERWLGAPVEVQGEAERTLQAAQLRWNLCQFELAPSNRGMLALRDAVRQLRRPEWRAARWGAAALVAVQVIGLNAWAWRLEARIGERRAEMGRILLQSHPGVRVVYDAPVQMARETDRLRAAAGRPGQGDLEVLLGAAAAAWPPGQGPVQTLRFETGRLTLSTPGWGPAQFTAFRERLAPAGFAVDVADGSVTVSRAGKAAA